MTQREFSSPPDYSLLPLSPEKKEQIRQKVFEMYQWNLRNLNAARVMEFLPDRNEFGIRDIEGNFYSFPTFEQVWAPFEKNWPLVQEKWLQGFQQLQLTPIALPLEFLISQVRQNLLHRDKMHKLFLMRSSKTEPLRRAPLDQRACVESRLTENGERMTYFPENYAHKNLGGKPGHTKAEVIATTRQTETPGWTVILTQDSPTLIHFDSLQVTELGRLRTGYTPEFYLDRLQNTPAYHDEKGFTVEDSLTHFLLRLSDTGEVSCNDRQSSTEYCIGSFSEYCLPRVIWIESIGRLRLLRTAVNYQSDAIGCRTAVHLR